MIDLSFTRLLCFAPTRSVFFCQPTVSYKDIHPRRLNHARTPPILVLEIQIENVQFRDRRILVPVRTDARVVLAVKLDVPIVGSSPSVQSAVAGINNNVVEVGPATLKDAGVALESLPFVGLAADLAGDKGGSGSRGATALHGEICGTGGARGRNCGTN